jgi:ubiquitin-like protein Pup
VGDVERGGERLGRHGRLQPGTAHETGEVRARVVPRFEVRERHGRHASGFAPRFRPSRSLLPTLLDVGLHEVLGVGLEDLVDLVEQVVETDVAERKEALDDDIDAILDEIDYVLETNAEDFVKSFIQKGGE